ncbi:MAG: hypothetical protein QXF24_04085, partial [Thermoproteota archaeon]
YWQHPVFPGEPWDPDNWYVVNEPMVNHPEDGNIPWLALKRVRGKPHIVSEYNHPAPNFYDAETVVTLAAYAALQDWDGIFLFDYGSGDDWNSMRIRGFFDVDQHPAKMATMIPAHAIFVRGDVSPAKYLVSGKLDDRLEVELIARGRASAWNLPDGRYVGMSPAAALVHRTALVAEGEASRIDVSPSGPVYISDTKEIALNVTDRKRGVLVVNTSMSVAVVGFGGGRSFDFGSLVVEPGETLLDGWCVVTVSVMDGEGFGNFKKLLLVAVGYATNTGMRVRDYGSGREIAFGSTELMEIDPYWGPITCGNSWGKAPTLVEGMPIEVKIKNSGDVSVWALDGVGNRKGQVPVSALDGYRTFTVGREFQTIWYEIAVEG